MSQVTELAREEAARAEAQPDEEEAEEVETDDLPEPEREREPEPQLPTEDDVKALGREYDRHEKALKKIMGDDLAGFVSCDDCGGVGFRPPAPPVELRVSADLLTCPECDGFGVLISGSKVPGHEAEQCVKCFGNGWIRKAEPPPPSPPVPLAAVQQAEDPRIAQLKAEGYTIVPPYVPTAS